MKLIRVDWTIVSRRSRLRMVGEASRSKPSTCSTSFITTATCEFAGVRMVFVFINSPKSRKASWLTRDERYCRLALTTARVFGPTTKRFLLAELRSHNHVLPNRSDRSAVLESLVETGQLAELDVDGVTYLWQPSNWQSGNIQDRVRILAPFDPLVRDRDRFEQLWGWTYRFEAYVPAAKRVRGYYAMPVLWRDHVIGWANAKVVDDHLEVELGFVDKRPRAKAFRLAAEAEVDAMAAFLNVEHSTLTY